MAKSCETAGCVKPAHSRGRCHACYKRVRKTGELAKLPVGDKCGFIGCDRPYMAKGYCAGHYQQKRSGRSLSPLYFVGQYRYDENGRKACFSCRQWLDVSEFYSNGKPRCRGCHRRHDQARKHHTTPEFIDSIYDRQNGCCPICSAPIERTGAYLDHDHSCCEGLYSCGECIRGLLCNKHNLMLGMIDDSVDQLRAAVEYLERGVKH